MGGHKINQLSFEFEFIKSNTYKRSTMHMVHWISGSVSNETKLFVYDKGFIETKILEHEGCSHLRWCYAKGWFLVFGINYDGWVELQKWDDVDLRKWVKPMECKWTYMKQKICDGWT